ncbi:hypothetical protein QDY28_24060 [Rhizobium sp. BR 362]|nr:hypothetical protein [Rhizobium leucaenae]
MARRQVLQSRNLVAQQLVVEFQAGVLEPKGRIFLAKLDGLGLKLLKSGFCLLRPLQQTRHQTAQRL